MKRQTALALVTLAALAACHPAASPPLTPAPHASPSGSETPPTASPSTAPVTAKPSPVSTPSGPFSPASPAELKSLIASTDAFAVDLYRQIANTGPGNLAMSPASIALALGMTYAGARGETARQMHDALHLKLDATATHRAFGTLLRSWAPRDGRPYELSVANRLFGEKTVEFRPSFLDATGSFYGAPLEALDFIPAPDDARKHINEWVAEQTRDKIVDLLPEGSIRDDTRLVLTNAIYFLGQWQRAFAKDSTHTAPFFAPGGQVDAELMHQEGSFAYGEVDGMKVLHMPYQGDDLAMTVLLPDAVDGLSAVEEKLSADALQRWIGSTGGQRVRLWLPRFKIAPEAPIALGKMLRDQGMPLPFDRTNADLGGIADLERLNENLVISEVFHKAFVEVDEKGTEAAAATGVIVVGITRAAPVVEPKELRADHPFLFLIRDTRSGAILFMGRVTRP